MTTMTSDLLLFMEFAKAIDLFLMDPQLLTLLVKRLVWGLDLY